MKKMMILALGVAALAMVGAPPVAKAQLADAIAATNQGIAELTDFPANGKRHTVELNKLGGADVRQMAKANALFKDALAKAGGGIAGMKLQEAINYSGSRMHKEARLNAQGALYHLCQQAGGQPQDVCSKAPKFGSYVAP
jgi:hypothetical protein